MNTANKNHLGYVGKLSDRDSDSWFTPKKYIEAARAVLGSVDFDPFSSADANITVQALKYYTKEDDSLHTDWPIVNNIWCNPPYGRGICGDAIKAIVEKYKLSFGQGIVLVNNATDTKWWHELAKVSSSICFTDHRIAFFNTDGKSVSGNTRGQCFFLLSEDESTVSRFKEVFSEYGKVLSV